MIENSLHTYLNVSSPKVVALYEAVCTLSREGADPTQMKVSEIAAKAGIGKGTTYDYFKSREELIAKAILYTIYKQVQVIDEKIQYAEGFQNKINVVLDTMFQEKGTDNNLFQKIMLFFHDIGSFPPKLREEFMKCMPEMKAFENVGKNIFEAAKEEGIIQEGLNPYYIRTAFFNTIMNYAVYKHQNCCKLKGNPLNEEEVKQRLYENLVYSLRMQPLST